MNPFALSLTLKVWSWQDSYIGNVLKMRDFRVRIWIYNTKMQLCQTLLWYETRLDLCFTSKYKTTTSNCSFNLFLSKLHSPSLLNWKLTQHLPAIVSSQLTKPQEGWNKTERLLSHVLLEEEILFSFLTSTFKSIYILERNCTIGIQSAFERSADSSVYRLLSATERAYNSSLV